MAMVDNEDDAARRRLKHPGGDESYRYLLGEDEGIMLCPDHHRCENFAVCVENPVDEGSYYCDCDASPLSNEQKYAGLYCEHEATTYCSPSDTYTYHSFCTNGGKCKKKVEAWEQHKGCHCNAGYVGSHCQFIEGSEVPNWGGNPSEGRANPYNADEGGGLSAGGIFGLVFLAVAVVVGAILYKSGKVSFHLKRDEREDVAAGGGGSSGDDAVEAATSPKAYGMSADLHLDADGGVLQEAVEEKQEGEKDAMKNEEGEDGMMEEAEII